LVCVPHKHKFCGFLVDAQGLHGFVSNKTPGTARHHTLNKLVAEAMVSAGIQMVLDNQIGGSLAAQRPFTSALQDGKATDSGLDHYVSIG